MMSCMLSVREEAGWRVEEPRAGSLEDLVLERLRSYATNLQGHEAKNLYALIMPHLERPVIRLAMELARGCELHAAVMLGIRRSTLRERLDALGLSSALDEGHDRSS